MYLPTYPTMLSHVVHSILIHQRRRLIEVAEVQTHVSPIPVTDRWQPNVSRNGNPHAVKSMVALRAQSQG